MPKSLNRKSIFLVRTPLQYLNALEAKSEFRIQNEDAWIILFTDYQPSLGQINKIIRKAEWGKITRIFRAVKSKGTLLDIYNKLYGWIRIKMFFLNYKRTENLFIGHIEDVWMRFVANKIKADKTILLDDGVATLKIAAKRYNSNPLVNYPSNNYQKRKTFLHSGIFEEIILGKQNLVLPKVTFFTVYDKITLLNSDTIIKNNYPILYSCKNHSQVKIAEIWFIGQPLLEYKMIQPELLVKSLNTIKNKWGNTFRYLYIPHRSEKNYDLIIDQGFEILSFQSPVELEIIDRNKIPHAVISFSSSALINLSKLYSLEEMKIYFIHSNMYPFSYSPDFQIILKYFEEDTELLKINLNK